MTGFLQNEKKKDKEVTARIDKILKHRDEVLQGVDISQYASDCYGYRAHLIPIAKIEANADHLVCKRVIYTHLAH